MPLDTDKIFNEYFNKFQERIKKYELKVAEENHVKESESVTALKDRKPKCYGAINITLDDIIDGIKLGELNLKRVAVPDSKIATAKYDPIEVAESAFVKLTLKKSAGIVLYKQESFNVLRNSEEGRRVDDDNQRYEYLTIGLGRKRYRYTKETQTFQCLRKFRGINTDSILMEHAASYVSNFEMFDTYKDIEWITESVAVNGQKAIQVTTYKLRGVDEFDGISQMPNFKLALIIMLRILASNTYEWQQRRFRNMILPDPLSMELQYLYRLNLLWSFVLNVNSIKSNGAPYGPQYNVTDMNWCPKNADILAVAYSADFQQVVEESSGTSYGCIAIWNIKNPVNTERFYIFHSPAMAVSFSPFIPSLIAIGLYDGTVYVYNIMHLTDYLVAAYRRPYYEPVSAIQWIEHCDADYYKPNNPEPFLVLYRDSSVICYTIIQSPHLLRCHKIKLNRVEMLNGNLNEDESGSKVKSDGLLANRHPQGINLYLDALHNFVYYISTDEGCLHKCSITFNDNHLQYLHLHDGGINAMEFSPWSPKLYLTCSNDWSIRLWLVDITKPLITLKYHMRPILKASWSTTHSTIIISLTGGSIDVWDLKQSTLKPLSSTAIQSPGQYTTFGLSNCGRSIAVGNNQGQVDLLALEDMPFPPNYQYRYLMHTLYDIISIDHELLREVKSLGFIGYDKESNSNSKLNEREFIDD